MASYDRTVNERELRRLRRELVREDEERQKDRLEALVELRRQREQHVRQIQEERHERRGNEYQELPSKIEGTRVRDVGEMPQSPITETAQYRLQFNIPDRGTDSVRERDSQLKFRTVDESLGKDYIIDRSSSVRRDVKEPSHMRGRQIEGHKGFATELGDKNMDDKSYDGSSRRAEVISVPVHSTPKSETLASIDTEIKELDRRLAMLKQDRQRIDLSEGDFGQDSSEKPDNQSAAKMYVPYERDNDMRFSRKSLAESQEATCEPPLENKLQGGRSLLKERGTETILKEVKPAIRLAMPMETEYAERVYFERQNPRNAMKNIPREGTELPLSYECGRNNQLHSTERIRYRSELQTDSKRDRNMQRENKDREIKREMYPATSKVIPPATYWPLEREVVDQYGNRFLIKEIGNSEETYRNTYVDEPDYQRVNLKIDSPYMAPMYENRPKYIGPQKVSHTSGDRSEVRTEKETCGLFTNVPVGKLDDRTRRELNIIAQEEQLKRMEIELNERQRWVEVQEKKKVEIDPYEEALTLKERELAEKLKKLKEREATIREREIALRTYKDTKIDEKQQEVAAATDRAINTLSKDVLKSDKVERYKEIGNPVRVKTEITAPIKDPGTVEIDTTSVTGLETKVNKTTNNEEINPDKNALYPKFSVFSGEEPKSKSEASYEEWKYEVRCVRNDRIHSEHIIAQAIRKSLRGQAKRVLLPLGPTANIEEILKRLEGVFGNVATGESVLQEFYTSSQKQDESVAAWGLRLEEILQKAVDKGHVRQAEKNDMLRNKFWKSLRSDRLKNATRTKFETLTEFDMLRRAVRAEEHEMKVQSGIQHQLLTSDRKSEKNRTEESQVDSLLARIESLEKEMKDRRQQRPSRWQQRGKRQQFREINTDERNYNEVEKDKKSEN